MQEEIQARIVQNLSANCYFYGGNGELGVSKFKVQGSRFKVQGLVWDKGLKFKFMRIFFTLLILLSPVILLAQHSEKTLIQFSGVIVDGNDLKPIPFTNIIIKNSYRGTMADYYGFFSIVAQKNDTIQFTAVGYKKALYVIPDSLDTDRYSLIQMLFADTVILRETVIYPWPTKEQFRDAFLNLRVPDDDLERAKRNLALAEMRERGKHMAMDGSQNFKNTMQQHQNRLYYAGQFPPNNLLNPIAWSEFIRAWKNGELKR
jgi:hypothetical protein